MVLIPLTSGAYSSQSVIANAQRCVNLYPESNPKATNPPVPVTHYQRPGLVRIGGAPVPEPPPPEELTFLAVGDTNIEGPTNPAIATSATGDDWDDQLTGFGEGGEVWSVTFGNDIYVAGGRTVTAAEIETSSDAETWTPQAHGFGAGGNVETLAFGNGIFLAGGYTSAVGRLQTSTDNGETWLTQTTGFDAAFPAFIAASFYDGAQYFIGGRKTGSIGGIETSPDAINWTSRVVAGFNTVNGFAYNGTDTHVAVGTTGSAARIVVSADNGITWSPVTDTFGGAGSTAHDVAFGNGVFVAVGQASDGTAHISTSPDGTTWTARTANFGVGGAIVQAIAFGSGKFIVTGISGADTGQINICDDAGETWLIAHVLPGSTGFGRGVFAK